MVLKLLQMTNKLYIIQNIVKIIFRGSNMNIYAISDLHLSNANPKPMDIFGDNWKDHWNKIKNDWLEKVKEGDIILIPGDISWALTLDEALLDLIEISKMPGRKILSRGNHDYWWSSPAKMRKALPHDMEIVQNDFIETEEFLICGTRGWILQGDERFDENDSKIFNREIIRLGLSLSKASSCSDKPIIVMMHFPPFNEKKEPSEFIEVMNNYNVKYCVYGHLHGESLKNVREGVHHNINFIMASCDYLNFRLKRIF